MKWNDTQIEFMKKHYPIRGIQYCINELGVSLSNVRYWAKKLNLHMSADGLSKLRSSAQYNRPRKYKVDVEQFKSVVSPEIAYLLGLLWADGYVFKKGNQHQISISMLEGDINDIRSVFDMIGDWSFIPRTRNGRRPSVTVITSNRPLVDFLYSLEYKSKSNSSADKVLSIIPDDLKPYWFRGLFDGDGCLYLSKYPKLSIASSYEQDWTYMEKVLKMLNVKYGIYRTKREKSQYSHLVIYTKIGIKTFCDFMYSTPKMFGLKRKYEKILLLNKRFFS